LTALHLALNIQGAESDPMRIVSKYRQRAQACRELAKLAANLDDMKVFEDTAQKWELLADLRIGDIEPGRPKDFSQRDSVLSLRTQPWPTKNS
jgi:hypothetical protein